MIWPDNGISTTSPSTGFNWWIYGISGCHQQYGQPSQVPAGKAWAKASSWVQFRLVAGIFLDDAASGHVICGCWVTQSLPPPVVMCAFLTGDGCILRPSRRLTNWCQRGSLEIALAFCWCRCSSNLAGFVPTSCPSAHGTTCKKKDISWSLSIFPASWCLMSF